MRQGSAMKSKSALLSALRERVLVMFQAGASKSDIAKAVGKDRKQVGKLLSEAIRGAR